jgi:hypothetical protein
MRIEELIAYEFTIPTIFEDIYKLNDINLVKGRKHIIV